MRQLFLALDTDDSGAISFDEFLEVTKIELEVNRLHSEVRSRDGGAGNAILADDAVQQRLRAAARQGVRFTCAGGLQPNLQLEGDFKMLTTQAIGARKAMRGNLALRLAAQQWWDGMDYAWEEDDEDDTRDSVASDLRMQVGV